MLTMIFAAYSLQKLYIKTKYNITFLSNENVKAIKILNYFFKHYNSLLKPHFNFYF